MKQRLYRWGATLVLVAGLTGCGSAGTRNVASRWVGVGGWSLNAVVGADASIPLQYAMFGIHKPSLAITSVRLTGVPDPSQLTGYNVVHHRWSPATKEYRISGTLVPNHSEHGTLRLEVRTNRWVRRVTWGSAAVRLVTNHVDWLVPVTGTAGAQGSFAMPELYVEELLNSSTKPITLLGLVQAGNYQILKTGAQATAMLPGGPAVPKGAHALNGFVVAPKQTVVVEVEFRVPRHNAVNVIFAPGLRIRQAGKVGTEPLQTSQWLTDFVPKPTTVVRPPNTVIP